jgi:hypothetical protein
MRIPPERGVEHRRANRFVFVSSAVFGWRRVGAALPVVTRPADESTSMKSESRRITAIFLHRAGAILARRGVATLGVLLLFLFDSCFQPALPPAPPDPPKPPSRIVVFMVDRSGSFHRIQREGNFKGQDYFYLACDQIKQYVEREAGRAPELVIVRVIESASFTDETVAAHLDLTDFNGVFPEKEPAGAYDKFEHEEWQKRRAAFLQDANDERDRRTKSFLEKMDELKKRGASNMTDIVNAFKALLQDLKSMPHYPKRIIVYSDFKDNQNRLDSAGVIDFGGDTEIEGRFVSINDMKPREYENLVKAWQRILNNKVAEFKTPIKSIQ